ncbi:MAG: hypothetical protein PUP90_02880 [Nostoc sp. S4]|nr:hypothetical protein [Nostoc sp. S4]
MMKTATPIGMLVREDFDLTKRGYIPIPEKWDYDPKTQTSNIIEMGGSTEPTTVSTVAATTGHWATGEDSDQSNDDKGSD